MQLQQKYWLLSRKTENKIISRAFVNSFAL